MVYYCQASLLPVSRERKGKLEVGKLFKKKAHSYFIAESELECNSLSFTAGFYFDKSIKSYFFIVFRA